jgi:hypothetical protein
VSDPNRTLSYETPQILTALSREPVAKCAPPGAHAHAQITRSCAFSTLASSWKFKLSCELAS